MLWRLIEASRGALIGLLEHLYGAEVHGPRWECPVDMARWSQKSRKAAETMLVSLRRRAQLPHPCNALLLQFLLEPAPQLARWSDNVLLSNNHTSAACRQVMLPTRVRVGAGGNLIFSAQPMTAAQEGRYAEMRVDALSGDNRCGIVMGVTLRRPGAWEGFPPTDIYNVPLCIWGLPKCSMPQFKVGARIGYLVTWDGDLVLFINDVEVGRARQRRELASRGDVWLVVDLSHDVMAVTLLDTEPPKDSGLGFVPAARRCSRRSASAITHYRRRGLSFCRRILNYRISNALAKTLRLPKAVQAISSFWGGGGSMLGTSIASAKHG